MGEWRETVRGRERTITTKLKEQVIVETNYIKAKQIPDFPYGAYDIAVYLVDPKRKRVMVNAPLDSFYTNSKQIYERQLELWCNYWANLNETVKFISAKRKEQERLKKCYR